MKGVVKTRVGYCGGKKDKPTYQAMGKHTETVQIDYDTEIVSYEDIINKFWDWHNPTSRWSVQYASRIFYHTEGQKEVAERTKKEREERLQCPLVTTIEPFVVFHKAETYHQHYLKKQRQTPLCCLL